MKRKKTGEKRKRTGKDGGGKGKRKIKKKVGNGQGRRGWGGAPERQTRYWWSKGEKGKKEKKGKGPREKANAY
jgi:hypothetical protein